MDKLNIKLNKLPRARMGFGKRTKLKFSLYVLIWQKKSRLFLLGLKNLKHVPAALLVLLSLVFSIPAYAYNSPRVTEGHILYPVKKVIEEVEIKTASTEIEIAQKYEKFSERRLDEAKVISENIDSDEDRENLSKTIEAAVELQAKAEVTTKYVPGKALGLEKNMQREKLNSIAEAVGIEEKEELIEDIAEAMDQIDLKEKQTKFFQERLRNASTTINTKENERKEQKKENFDDLDYSQKAEELKESINSLKTEFTSEDFEEKDLETLFERLDRRVEKVDESIGEKDSKNINGLINSTKAITNNAEHFIKKKGKGNSGNSSQGRGKSGK
ncbi:hypothetical protein C0584_03740 [Candidatus Parcubacteria bacterium]|nr:MAG: hypothetical protein C0584_03740 [Candidatus Parcubacteria bacterium]